MRLLQTIAGKSRNDHVGSEGAGRLPSLIIIGAQKCATTSFHFYLDSHPEIGMAADKELNFFIEKGNWHRGLEWYKSNFRGPQKLLGEASPNYTAYPINEGVAERMARVNPDLKLIYLVRDPIDRMISHYAHNYASGAESRRLPDAFMPLDRSNPYLCRSLYQMQIEQFLNWFPRQQVFIASLEEARADSRAVLQRLFQFLGVDHRVESATFDVVAHTSRRKRRRTELGDRLWHLALARSLDLVPWKHRGPVKHIALLPFSRPFPKPILPPDMRERIVDYLQGDMVLFRQTSGQLFSDWSV